MDKQVIIYTQYEEKKHSVCYKTKEDVAVGTVYVMRSHLGRPFPKSIKLTVEEVGT